MKPTKGFRINLPEGIRIGQRFLLRFDDPRVKASAYQGRLQELSRSGLLCFDAPTDVRPPKGTPVTVRSLPPEGGRSCTFSSAIRGRGTLRGHLPVLLVEPPADLSPGPRHRGAQRVTVCLRGEVSYREAPRCPPQRAAAVVMDLSGGGAQVYVRQALDCEYLQLSIDVPDTFVEETARRSTPRGGLSPRRLSLASDPFGESCDLVRERYRGLRARVAACRLHCRDERGPVYAVSLSFCQSQETCFQLVRFYERQCLRQGLGESPPERAPHAVAGRRQRLAPAA